MLFATQAQEEAALLRFTVMPDDHRNYAATWLTLAAAIALLGRRAVVAASAANSAKQTAALWTAERRI